MPAAFFIIQKLTNSFYFVPIRYNYIFLVHFYTIKRRLPYTVTAVLNNYCILEQSYLALWRLRYITLSLHYWICIKYLSSIFWDMKIDKGFVTFFSKSYLTFVATDTIILPEFIYKNKVCFNCYITPGSLNKVIKCWIEISWAVLCSNLFGKFLFLKICTEIMTVILNSSITSEPFGLNTLKKLLWKVLFDQNLTIQKYFWDSLYCRVPWEMKIFSDSQWT